MNFTCLPAQTLEASMTQVVECGGECTAHVVLGASVVWCYYGEEKIQIRAFHSHRCALELMNPSLLNQA